MTEEGMEGQDERTGIVGSEVVHDFYLQALLKESVGRMKAL